jgi:cell division protein FtsL
MSAAPARRTTGGRPTKPAKLRVVDKAALRRRARQRTLVTLAAGLVTVSLFGVALLYGQLVEGQRELDTIRAEIAQAEAERARLEREVAVASTPDAIVERATALGMVRAVDPQYLIAVRTVEGDR